MAIMDALKITLVLNLIAAAVGMSTAIALAWRNAESRNLALAAGTLVAAMILFVIQLRFELQRSVTRDRVSSSFTIDFARPSIRQWKYARGGWRIGVESGASEWLAANNPQAFGGSSAILISDLAVYSLVSFLGAQESDWQMRRVEYKSNPLGTMFIAQSVSKDVECRIYSETELKSLLKATGNTFAEAFHLLSGRLCLPPKSTLDISRSSVSIRNPICQISWNLELPGGIFYVEPESGGQVPMLPNGRYRYETQPFGFAIEAVTFALRAQSQQASRYREWLTRVAADTHEWFED
jgi:hypothetical protein